jgi:CRISPR/Cas system-associated endoribonuclease Cas2
MSTLVSAFCKRAFNGMIEHSALRSLTEEIKGYAIDEDDKILIIDLCEHCAHKSILFGKS